MREHRPNYHPVILSQITKLEDSVRSDGRTVLKLDNRLALARQHQEKRGRLLNMNWPQFKIFAALIAAESMRVGQERGGYSTTVPELVKLLGMKKSARNNEDIFKELYGMAGKVLVVPKHYDHVLGPETVHVIPAFAMISMGTMTGKVYLQLNRHVLPYLHKLQDQYTLALLSELIALPSIYSGRLFMVMNQCKGFQYEERRTFNMPWMMEYMGCPEGTTAHDFIQQLKTNRQQIRKHTAWTFDLVFLRDRQDRRRVAAVRFDNIKKRGGTKLIPDNRRH